MNITTHDGILAVISTADSSLLAANIPLLQVGDFTYVDITALPPGIQADAWLTKLAENGYDEKYAEMFAHVSIDVKIDMFTSLANYNSEDGDIAMLIDSNWPALRQLSNPEFRLLTIYCLKNGPETANALAEYLYSLN